MKTCADCKFYQFPAEHEGTKYGFCFRYPPKAESENKSFSPVVRADRAACGEFKAKWFRK